MSSGVPARRDADLERRGTPQPLDLASIGPDRLREVAGTFATGVTVVTTRSDAGLFGCTANAVTSLSLDPPLMLVCLNPSTNTHPQLLEARAFAINVIRYEDGAERICRLFAGKSEDKFGGVDWRPGVTGCPVLAASLAYLECELDGTYDGGDHTIFTGRVVRAERFEGEPIVFYRGRFTRLADPQ